MREIPLTQGKAALVDDADFDLLNSFRWFVYRSTGRAWYAARHVGEKQIKMHNFILGVLHVDHRDGDGLNNQRCNLRQATKQQNGQNRPSNKNNKSGYKGVSWDKERELWAANIHVSGKKLALGRYRIPENAAQAYNFSAEEHFGEFAWFNRGKG